MSAAPAISVGRYGTHWCSDHLWGGLLVGRLSQKTLLSLPVVLLIKLHEAGKSRLYTSKWWYLDFWRSTDRLRARDVCCSSDLRLVQAQVNNEAAIWWLNISRACLPGGTDLEFIPWVWCLLSACPPKLLDTDADSTVRAHTGCGCSQWITFWSTFISCEAQALLKSGSAASQGAPLSSHTPNWHQASGSPVRMCSYFFAL